MMKNETEGLFLLLKGRLQKYNYEAPLAESLLQNKHFLNFDLLALRLNIRMCIFRLIQIRQ